MVGHTTSNSVANRAPIAPRSAAAAVVKSRISFASWRRQFKAGSSTKTTVHKCLSTCVDTAGGNPHLTGNAPRYGSRSSLFSERA
jgi:hypothetical protein